MTPLPDRLRDETRLLHEETEQQLYSAALRTGTLQLDQYAHLLLIHSAFHRALEQAIDQYPAFFKGYEPNLRRKLPWLVADLEKLGLPLPDTASLLTGWLPAELVGAAYVGEGSMLGGKTVWHYLHQNERIQPLLEGARFYRGYGAETGSRWRAFGAFVTQASEPDAVVAGAKRAFRLYKDLFTQTQPLADPVTWVGDKPAEKR